MSRARGPHGDAGRRFSTRYRSRSPRHRRGGQLFGFVSATPETRRRRRRVHRHYRRRSGPEPTRTCSHRLDELSPVHARQALVACRRIIRNPRNRSARPRSQHSGRRDQRGDEAGRRSTALRRRLYVRRVADEPAVAVRVPVGGELEAATIAPVPGLHDQRRRLWSGIACVFTAISICATTPIRAATRDLPPDLRTGRRWQLTGACGRLAAGAELANSHAISPDSNPG